MRKWIRFICPLIMIFILTSFRFSATVKSVVPETLKVNGPTEVLYPKCETNEMATFNKVEVPLFLGATYIGFKEALAFKESQGNYFVTNTLGYIGKYQFGVGTLKLVGVYSTHQFLNDPVLQEKVFLTNVSRNKWILRRDIGRFVGKKVGGIEITESGILAAAHLAGPGNVKKYLRSYGKHNVADAYGSSIAYYMRKFSGYDVSVISAKRNAKV